MIRPGCLRADPEPWADPPMLVIACCGQRTSTSGVPFQDLACLIARRSGCADIVRDSVPSREGDRRWLGQGT